MRKSWILVLIVIAGMLAGAVTVRLIGPIVGLTMSETLYPKAPRMPPAVSESADSLLARYEKLLAQQAPTILSALQPGLSDERISALEVQYEVKLTADLRSLYRWRNGTSANQQICTFPSHRFVPLEEALAEMATMQQHARAATAIERRAHEALGRRINILSDGGGDGYYYDPDRTEAEGSFFYCFLEDGSYDFYPAFRNYLAETLSGFDTGVYRFGNLGAETADFAKAQTLHQNYSAAPAR